MIRKIFEIKIQFNKVYNYDVSYESSWIITNYLFEKMKLTVCLKCLHCFIIILNYSIEC